MHEIVTLQFGQQSNYLGTHFWNTQESYFTYPPEEESPVNHDILFRPGLAPDGSDTFTPRAVIYDLKGAFGTMKKLNALYETEADVAPSESDVWPSKPIVQRTEPIPPSAYQSALDAGLSPPRLSTSSVRYWSDYSHIYYHPKSLVQLSEFQVNDSLMPFENWDVGVDLFEKLEREVELVDRDLRPFVEECDGIQGLQIITGVDDAWGGFASGWLERLRDEYGKLSIWTWGVGEQGGNTTTPREKRMQQTVNAARSLNVLAEQSSLFIPLSNRPAKTPSYLQMETSPWHIGALHCVALETLTMPSRLRTSHEGHGTLADLEQIINLTGKRPIGKLEMSVADPDVLASKASPDAMEVEKVTSRVTSPRGEEVEKENENELNEFDIDVFTKDYRIAGAHSRKKDHVFGRVEISRGEWSTNGEYGGRDRFNDGPLVERYTAPLLFPLLTSFPSIFDVGKQRGSKLAVHTGLTTSTAVADQIRTLEHIARRTMHLEDRETLSNNLQSLAEEYDEGYESDSGSEMDY